MLDESFGRQVRPRRARFSGARANGVRLARPAPLTRARRGRFSQVCECPKQARPPPAGTAGVAAVGSGRPACDAHADMSDRPPITLAVLVSGSGTTLANLLAAIARRELNAAVRVVIGSRPGLTGLDRATAAGIPTAVIDRKSFDAAPPFSRAVFAEIDRAGVDLVCLAGWLCLLDVPDRWAGRVMNIHPALLPSFGGRGLYGRRVHQAVLDHGCKVSGCTVHFVDNDYDAGPIILQRTCDVADDDTADTLAARVFEQECVAYPEAIRLFHAGRLQTAGRRVRVLPATN